MGVESESFDIEKVRNIEIVDSINQDKIKKELSFLKSKIAYTPPKFSAKRIDGKRAYELARNGEEVNLSESVMNVFNTKFISYRHPFITIDVTVSEGSYIRSYAQILLEKLKRVGTLSYLERLNEGKFFFDNEKDLDPLDYIDLPINKYSGTYEWINTGRKISIDYLEEKDDGKYLIILENFFSIIEIKDGEVSYLLNKVNKLC